MFELRDVTVIVLRRGKHSPTCFVDREEITVDQLVDVVVGNRQYKPCLYFYNKIDTVTIEEVSHYCVLWLYHLPVGLDLIPNVFSYKIGRSACSFTAFRSRKRVQKL